MPRDFPGFDEREERVGDGDQAVTFDGVVHRMTRAWLNDGVTGCQAWVAWTAWDACLGLVAPPDSDQVVPEPVTRAWHSSAPVTCMACVADEPSR